MPPTTSSEPTIAVVTPAHRAEAEIGACVDALLSAGFAAGEIVVVDDGSPDRTGEIAARRGVRVVRNETAQRPAWARNRGVAEVDADIVVFVDADVVIKPGARARIRRHFSDDPGLSAVIGSYDAEPSAPAVVSRYRNLLHHFVHQRSQTDAKTFWTGFGAVRRADFQRLGGLDRAWENIEDVEFGLRLTQDGGRILLDKDLQATHLKAWTLRSMFLTDLNGRAKPWTRLILRGRAGVGDLNTARAHRVSAAAVALTLAGVAAAPLAAEALWLAGAGALGFGAANAPFFRFLARRRGLRFAAMAAPYHAAHYLAALLGYVTVRFIEPRAPQG